MRKSRNIVEEKNQDGDIVVKNPNTIVLFKKDCVLHAIKTPQLIKSSFCVPVVVECASLEWSCYITLQVHKK